MDSSMMVYGPEDESRFQNGCIAVLGMFDGIHLGHRALISEAVELKKQHRLPVVMYTFTDHPRNRMPGGEQIPLIMTNREKTELSGQLGVDAIVFDEFTDAFRRLSPQAFIRSVLLERLQVKYVVVGENYRFGYRHEGDYQLLHQYPQFFSVVVKPCQTVDGHTVSSSRIRHLVTTGQIEEANRLLGRPFLLEGEVVHGRKVGRELGFQTANLHVDKAHLLPMPGVYLTRAQIKGKRYPALTNIGNNPTFGLDTVQIETHILDFKDNIYQKRMSVLFLRYVRKEIRFSGREQLIEQLAYDIQSARHYFETLE